MEALAAFLRENAVGRVLARGLRAAGLSGVARRLRDRRVAGAGPTTAGAEAPEAACAGPPGKDRVAVAGLGPPGVRRGPRA